MGRKNENSFSGMEVSISHITKKDADILAEVASSNRLSTTVSRYEFGFFVVVPSEPQESLEAMKQAGLSAAFLGLVMRASMRGDRVLLIDRDADDLAGAPTFSWD